MPDQIDLSLKFDLLTAVTEIAMPINSSLFILPVTPCVGTMGAGSRLSLRVAPSCNTLARAAAV